MGTNYMILNLSKEVKLLIITFVSPDFMVNLGFRSFSYLAVP